MRLRFGFIEGRESKLMRKQNPLHIHPSFISGGVLCDCVGRLAVEGGQRTERKSHGIGWKGTRCVTLEQAAEYVSRENIGPDNCIGGTEETGYSRIKQLQVASWLKRSVHRCFVLNSEINNYIMRNDLWKSENSRFYKQWESSRHSNKYITIHRFYTALERTHRALFECDSEWVTAAFIARLIFFIYTPKWYTDSAVGLLRGWCHMKLLLSRRTLCVHHIIMHQIIVSFHYDDDEVMLNVLRCQLTY